MPSKGKKAPREESKKKHVVPCKRNCANLVDYDEETGVVLCLFACAKGAPPCHRMAPPKSGYISCPHHPEYKPNGRGADLGNSSFT